MEGFRYLVGKGHKRIGFLSNRPEEIRDWKYGELPDLYRSFGLDFDSSLFVSAEFEPDAIRAAAQKMAGAYASPLR